MTQSACGSLKRTTFSGAWGGRGTWMLVAALVSLAVSAWAGYAESVPNPDAVYYLTAADHFVRGEWHEGFAVYRWPLYSLNIAAVMVVTGLHAFPAALVVNAVFTAGLAAVFVYLVALLSSDDRVSMIAAALLIGFSSRLMLWEPQIVRDHGYWFFLMAAIATAVADYKAPSLFKKLLLLVEIVLATLFRVEGAFLLVLVPGFMIWIRTRSPALRAATVAAVLVAALASIAGFALWTSGGLKSFAAIEATLSHRIDVLNSSLIDPIFAGGHTWYAGMVVATVISVLLVALGNTLSVILIFAFWPKRVMSPFTGTVFFWFALGQLPILVVFGTLELFIAWRYAMGIALVALVAIVFTFRSAWGECLEGRKRSCLFMLVAPVAVAASWVTTIPRPTDIGYLRDAGLWMRANIDPRAYVWVNEPRMIYYSGRTQGLSAAHPYSDWTPDLGRPDSFFANDRAVTDPLPDWLAAMKDRKLIKSFPGSGGRVAEIFVRCPNPAYCP